MLRRYTHYFTVFQSTHPVRGATHMRHRLQAYGTISIHAPREGCDMHVERVVLGGWISIHAPREGCDIDMFSRLAIAHHFNPRTP